VPLSGWGRMARLPESDRLKEEAVRVIAPAHGAQIPMQVPAMWEVNPPGSEVSLTSCGFG